MAAYAARRSTKSDGTEATANQTFAFNREETMLRIVVPAVALVFGVALAGPASAQSGVDLVKQSVAAQGGAAALMAAKTTVIKGEAKHWEPGQSYSAAGESRFLGDSTYTQTVDNDKRMARFDWDRDMKYPAVERAKFSEITGQTFGVVIDDKGEQKRMSNIRLATHLRERDRASPRLLVRALENPTSIAALPDQSCAGQTQPAVSIKSRNHSYIVCFDRASHLPTVVRTRDADAVYGDSNYDLIFSDWKDAPGGSKRAHTLSYQLNGMEVQRLTIKEISINNPVAANTFPASEPYQLASAAEVPPNANYQWIIRRMFLGRLLDSDKIYYPDNGGFKLVELAPNVQHVQGGGANNLIVSLKDGLLIIDAPADEGQSTWVINAAKEKYPGKPIKYLVLSHHHMDHTGGTRAYVAEGATVVIPGQARPFFEKMIAAQNTIKPDALAKAPKPATITDVKDTMSIKDETVEINLYNIPNPHVDGMIIAHITAPNLVWVTDLISPRGPVGRTGGSVAVGNALRQHNINNATIVGGHGTTAKQADITQALAAN
jgi:glyoxylase-like metal-dependent hydrolase (beta-lactamase superfamily II)